MSFSPTFRFKLRVYKSLNETISEGVRKLRLIGKVVKLLDRIFDWHETSYTVSLFYKIFKNRNFKQTKRNVIKETKYSQKRPHYLFFLNSIMLNNLRFLSENQLCYCSDAH